MIGVSQANRVLELVCVLKDKGAQEQTKKRTAGSRCFSNPYRDEATKDGAPYIFITKKGIIRFGYILTTSSVVPEHRIDRMINGFKP